MPEEQVGVQKKKKAGYESKIKSSPLRIYFNRTMFSPSFILYKIVIYSFAAVHMHFYSLTFKTKKNISVVGLLSMVF